MKVAVNCQECGKERIVYPSVIKHGGGKYCSVGCATTYRNKTDNPVWREGVKEKISKNHADVSGENNPMYGKRGHLSPSYIDGRRIGADGTKLKDAAYRLIAFKYIGKQCQECGVFPKGRHLHVHHKDGNRNNNNIPNLMVLCVRCHNIKIHKRNRDELGRFASEEVMANVGN